eukprot:2431709-Pyramimonas_sp.AAC.1
MTTTTTTGLLVYSTAALDTTTAPDCNYDYSPTAVQPHYNSTDAILLGHGGAKVLLLCLNTPNLELDCYDGQY